MADSIDILKVKINDANSKLPKETLEAIAAVDWRSFILKLREKKGLTFEQLGELETETELLLCGLLSPVDYPKELRERMRLQSVQVDELLNEMNVSVFNRIKEELVKRTAMKPTPTPTEPKIETPKIDNTTTQLKREDMEVLNKAGINISETPANNLPIPEKLELEPAHKIESEFRPILAQKLSGYVQNNIVSTEHSIEDKTQKPTPAAPKETTPPKPKLESYPKGADPYRVLPE